MMRVPRVRISAAEARRVALAAQGFAGRAGRRRAGRSRCSTVSGSSRSTRSTSSSRAHYLPCFARLGPYERETLDQAAPTRRGGCSSTGATRRRLLPVELHPLLRWRMERAHDDAWGGMRRVARERPQLLARRARAGASGPARRRELAEERPRPRGRGGTGRTPRSAIELLFWSGEVTIAAAARFERFYDLPERVLPRPCSTRRRRRRGDAQRALVALGARALGVAAPSDLRDYFRLPGRRDRPRVAELEEAGGCCRSRSRAGTGRAYLHRDARVPRPSTPARCSARSTRWCGSALAPSACSASASASRSTSRRRKRVHGYYVLPFLLGDRLVARADLKADRQAGVLRVHAVHLEPGAPAETGEALRDELRLLAGWLGLDGYS